ncbi:ocr-like anti-restriction [Bacillus phage Shbh1]|uniref:Anti-restriction-like protein n=1 Tax=Bacillus phage Shbh1 TaxID=1796992 RepID=A0A142F174_9CAUD|nr:ocr-like anti-restriction [Bacillus phage Shbh1]AMQ66531.1 anti-restriction-like protein [Bacillus phage Shbh1]
MTKLRIESRAYDFELLIGDEDSILDYFFTNYAKEDVYLCDAMHEQADNYVPVYHSDIWTNASDVQEYINEALEDGHLDGVTDITRILQVGYYEYYYALLDNNLDALCHNYIVDEVNKYLENLSEDEAEKVDLEEIAERIETYTDGIDRDIMFSHVDEYASHIIDDLTFILKGWNVDMSGKGN